jgi:hypothetical protein
MNEQPANPASGKPLQVTYYLYFPRAEDGKAVAALLRQRGFTVEDRPSADKVKWLVLAKRTVPSDIGARLTISDELERLAQQYSGEYDGSETAIPE